MKSWLSHFPLLIVELCETEAIRKERAMRISNHKIGAVVVLEMSGKITTGEPTHNLAKTFKELLEQGETLFVYNMLKVPWLDSGAIGEVVACRRRVMRKKGVIRLVLKGRSHDLLTMMCLDRVFKIFMTMEEALASLADWHPGEVPQILEPEEFDVSVM